jgi:hypothetical protein
MHKIRLDLDRLTVDSFPTAAVADERGTVHAADRSGHGPSCFTSCAGGGDPACTCPIP